MRPVALSAFELGLQLPFHLQHLLGAVFGNLEDVFEVVPLDFMQASGDGYHRAVVEVSGLKNTLVGVRVPSDLH